ncbi:MAG: hypothetical protein SPL83_05015 [Succinivibrio sp.]|nr:hypothetical protein [Succinivibrio sp.]MDY6262347.1 hypothetical protein [Succinivibrio sp.]
MINTLSINTVLSKVISKQIPLSAELLLKVVDANTSSYQLLDLMCDYLNSIQSVERKKDGAILCKLKQEKKILQEKYAVLNKNYNETVTALLESKESLVEQIKLNMEAKAQIQELEYRIKELENDLLRREILL